MTLYPAVRPGWKGEGEMPVNHSVAADWITPQLYGPPSSMEVSCPGAKPDRKSIRMIRNGDSQKYLRNNNTIKTRK